MAIIVIKKIRTSRSNSLLYGTVHSISNGFPPDSAVPLEAIHARNFCLCFVLSGAINIWTEETHKRVKFR